MRKLKPRTSLSAKHSQEIHELKHRLHQSRTKIKELQATRKELLEWFAWREQLLTNPYLTPEQKVDLYNFVQRAKNGITLVVTSNKRGNHERIVKAIRKIEKLGAKKRPSKSCKLKPFLCVIPMKRN